MQETGDDCDNSNLWLKVNTKKCPKCKTNIEKNSGCMHMTCQKCRHEFCWLCLGDYKKHQSETGIGLCNNFNDVQKINRTNIGDMAERMRVDRKMRKFAHFATRYNEHLRSVKLDQKRGDQLDHQI